MTPAQIVAILQLLIAFSVPQPTVDIVQGILEGQHATTTITIAPSSQSFGATVQTTTTNTPIISMPESKADITVRVDNPRPGSTEYAFIVSVLDEDGKPIEKAPITITTPQGVVHKTTNAQTGMFAADWRTTFTYEMTEPTTLTFTSGELTKTVSMQ